jgi:hypothetical protein
MAFEKKPGTGALFRNRDRDDNDRAPNLKGYALVEINGEPYELDIGAWTRESERAGKWLSLRVKLKTGAPDPATLQERRWKPPRFQRLRESTRHTS